MKIYKLKFSGATIDSSIEKVKTMETELSELKTQVDDLSTNAVLIPGYGDKSVQMSGNIAGTMGYYYSHINFTESGGEIYLTDTRVLPIAGAGTVDASFTTPAYSKGERICIVNGSKYTNGHNGVTAVVEAVEHNKLIFTGNLGFGPEDMVAALEEKPITIDDFTIFTIEKPGIGIIPVRDHAFAIGENTEALGLASSAEGKETKAIGNYGHTEGRNTIAYYAAHAEGGMRTGYDVKTLFFEEAELPAEELREENTEYYTTAKTSDITSIEAFVNGVTPDSANYASYKFKENGVKPASSSNNPLSKADDRPSVIFTEARGNESHAEGASTFAGGAFSHTEGTYTRAFGQAGHAEGYYTRSLGTGAHAEGNRTLALGGYSHAEGAFTEALWQSSHAEGVGSKAESQGTHAEGMYTKASGLGSHAEGGYTTIPSTVQYGHAEGFLTEIGAGAHYQHVQGKANIPMDKSYAHVVGWGETVSNAETQLPEIVQRKNIHTLKTTGEAWYAGDVYVGDEATKEKLVRQSQFDSAITTLADELETTSTSLNNKITTDIATVTETMPPLKHGAATNSTKHANGYVGTRTLKLAEVLKTQDNPVKYVLKVPKSYFTVGADNKLTPDPTTSTLFKNIAVIINGAVYCPHPKITAAVTITGYTVDDNYVTLSYNNSFGFETTTYTWDASKSFVILNHQSTDFSAITETAENSLGTIGIYAFSEGLRDAAIGNFSHAEGTDAITLGAAAHAEGNTTIASGQNAHAEGSTTFASGSAAHSEGYKTTAAGYCTHAEGLSTVAIGPQAHSEGHTTAANGAYSHTEGYLTKTAASANGAHAGGYGSEANKTGAFAHGCYVKATAAYQTVFGKYNDTTNGSKYVQVVGWGESTTTPRNIYTLDTSGNANFAGNLSISGNTLKVGNTTITETQLQKLLNLLDTIETE